MEPRRWSRLRALFDEALDLDPGERANWVATVTSDDPDLGGELARLLVQEERAEITIAAGDAQRDAISLGALAHFPAWDPLELVGRDVGGYQIEGLLGRGGMGVVYLARQRTPRRTVALKTLANPLGSAKERSRFRLEIEVLGALQHAAIAQVFDAGELVVDGRAVLFVAMELVEEALDIVRYAEGQGLERNSRIALLRTACEAVHHAHRRGIVHRDLKPANLLVGRGGLVKVIDFGLARVDASAQLGVTALLTLEGSVLGTLEYMSPEHVAGLPQDIDVRSDIFSLGCVLYELLVGRPPRELGGLSLTQAIQRIQTLDVHAPPSVPRPLRAVLARCLDRDPDRRYATAADLAADLGRFVQGESVFALRGQRIAAVTGFSRRHRVLLSALLAVIAALSIGLVRAKRATVRANRATEHANRETERANEETQHALQAQARTRSEADSAIEVATALSRVLTSVQSFANGRDAKVVDILRAVELSVPDVSDARARATVASVAGQGLLSLNELERAGPLLEGAARELTELEPPDSPRRLLALSAYADYLEQVGRYDESLRVSLDVLPLARERLGAHAYTTTYVGINAGVCYVRLGRLAEARDHYGALLEDIAAFPVPNPQMEVSVRDRLAQVHMSMDNQTEAKEELARAQDVMERNGGGGSLFAVALKATRASIEEQLENFDAALQLQLEALQVYATRAGTAGNCVIAALNAARLLCELDRMPEAAALLAEHAAALAEAEAEPARYHAHWHIVEAMLACRQRDFEAAEIAARKALALGAKLVPDGWPEDANARFVLVCALRGLSRSEDAVREVRAGLPTARRVHGAVSAYVLKLLRMEALLLRELGREAEAREVAVTAITALRDATSDPAVLESWSHELEHAEGVFDALLDGR